MRVEVRVLICAFLVESWVAAFLESGIYDLKFYTPKTKDEVKNVENCGGVGKLVKMRYRGCSDPDHCRTPDVSPSRLGVLGLLEVEFVPSKDVTTLGYEVVTNPLNSHRAEGEGAWKNVIPKSAVKRGQTYVYQSEELFPIWSSFYTFQFSLYNNDTNEVEVCGRALFEGVKRHPHEIF